MKGRFSLFDRGDREAKEDTGGGHGDKGRGSRREGAPPRSEPAAPLSNPAISLKRKPEKGRGKSAPSGTGPQPLSGAALRASAGAAGRNAQANGAAPAPTANKRPAAGIVQHAANAGGNTAMSQPMAAGGPPQREISAIGTAGSDLPPPSNATMLGHHMFDGGRVNRQRSTQVVLLLLVLGIGAAMYTMPDLRRSTLGYFRKGKESVVGLVRPKIKKRARSRRLPPMVGDGVAGPVVDPNQGNAALLANITKGNCQQLMRAQTVNDVNLKAPERIAIAECFLTYDNPAGAEETLMPLKPNLQRAPEALLNDRGPLGDALLTFVATELRMGKQREADGLVAGRCRQWKQTNTCVAKVMIHVDRRLEPSQVGRIFEVRGRLPAKSEARLWLAGAALAIQQNRPQIADQRFNFGLTAAPKDAIALRKALHEAFAVDLYRRGEMLKLKGVIQNAQRDLARVDPKAKIKLSTLGDLTAPVDKKRQVLRQLLSREDVTYRARGDVDLIDILGPESIRFGFEQDYLRLLKRTREFFNDRYRAAGSVMRRISMWEIRTTFSLKQWDDVVLLINRHEGQFGKEAALTHLRGATYLKQDSSAKFAMLAAQEFQAAMKNRGNWESLYALGLSFTRAGKTEAVPSLIRDLEKVLNTPGQRFWADMLKAEYYIVIDNKAGATRILRDWVLKEPGYLLPRDLLVKVLEKTDKSGAEEQRRAYEDLVRKTPNGMSPEAFGSPIGPLAYERRPVE